MPAYNEEGHPIASSRRNKKIFKNKGIEESGESDKGPESAESLKSAERLKLDKKADSAEKLADNGKGDPAGSLECDERTGSAENQRVVKRDNSVENPESDKRTDPAEKTYAVEKAHLYKKKPSTKRVQPPEKKRLARRADPTRLKKTAHSYDPMQLGELSYLDDSPESYEEVQPYDASPHETDPSYESSQTYESIHPDELIQPYDPTHPDELPESYESIQLDESSQSDATVQANATGDPNEIEEMNHIQYLKGRGAQFNPKNRFLKSEIVKEHIEGIDDWIEANPETQFLEENAKGLVNKVDSPDVGMWYSMNPYQGCEHGCTYCYARNVHEYWGYSAGLDFEQKIIVKKNAPELLRKFLMNPKWECVPLSLSGNTDCYQPAEKKFGITRQLLEVCLEFNQPVGIITKNAGILRDKDLLAKMAKKKLVSVLISITSFDEELRRTMEPRTTTARQRIRTIKELSQAGVRMGVMLGPMIPGLNEHELQRIMKAAAENGATFSAYTFIRLNGAVKLIFHDWLYKNFPDRADKVWHLIESGHGGKVNDSRFGVRMSGEGNIAQLVAQQYARYTQKYGLNAERWELDTTQFMRPGGQMKLF